MRRRHRPPRAKPKASLSAPRHHVLRLFWPWGDYSGHVQPATRVARLRGERKERAALITHHAEVPTARARAATPRRVQQQVHGLVAAARRARRRRAGGLRTWRRDPYRRADYEGHLQGHRRRHSGDHWRYQAAMAGGAVRHHRTAARLRRGPQQRWCGAQRHHLTRRWRSASGRAEQRTVVTQGTGVTPRRRACDARPHARRAVLGVRATARDPGLLRLCGCLARLLGMGSPAAQGPTAGCGVAVRPCGRARVDAAPFDTPGPARPRAARPRSAASPRVRAWCGA